MDNMKLAIDCLKERMGIMQFFLEIELNNLNEKTFLDTEKARKKHIRYMKSCVKQYKKAIEILQKEL